MPYTGPAVEYVTWLIAPMDAPATYVTGTEPADSSAIEVKSPASTVGDTIFTPVFVV